MRLRVKVEDQEFEVEVGDLHSRPIVATVDGLCFEVWPEEGSVAMPAAPPPDMPAGSVPRTAAPQPSPRRSRRTPGPAPATSGQAANVVFAPLPGVVDSVAVHPGDGVAAGQPLCVIEAMKMKNVIRAPHDGEIASVWVSVGQHVKHNDALVEYTE